MSELIPLDVLFGNPERLSPRISPDGKRLAYIAPDEGVLNVWLAAPDGSGARPVTRDRGRGIRDYFWAEDERSLVYAQDKDGDENWHLYQVDVVAGRTRDLTPFAGIQAQVIGTAPEVPDEILVGLNRRDKRVHDAYRVSLRTGRARLEARNPGDVVGWLADSRFEVRCAKAMRPDGGSELRVRARGSKEWRPLIAWGPDDEGAAHGFSPGDEGLFVESTHGADTLQLWHLRLDGGRQTLLARDERVDLGRVMLHPRKRHVEAVGFAYDRLSWSVLDATLLGDFARLAGAGLGDFEVISRDDADAAWLVASDNDTTPRRYHRYDRRTGTLSLLFSARPRLEAYRLSPMRPVTVKARDGLRLPCYLTLPAGRDRGLPLVLFVHGGPWGRDSWGFDPYAQWFADRGYAALQVNFRGSAGFGKKFLHAGDREWGAKMQDDLTDAVGWAVREGIADPRRVGIYGGSYGGYAALAGAAFTPDVYACAVDLVGPSNLETLIKSIPPYWEPLRRVFDLRVGDVDKEPGFLRKRSPLFRADRIKIPLLIAQGANDPRVKKAESEMIVSALRSKGKPVEYMLFDDEGHGLAKPENRLKFVAAAERFLARHLRPADPVAG
ncbi:MAG: S9 family peptidase [Elusimicrobia bacterium]|nr:S9 family peptidase [Elusimicrobiota bacterium]